MFVTTMAYSCMKHLQATKKVAISARVHRVKVPDGVRVRGISTSLNHTQTHTQIFKPKKILKISIINIFLCVIMFFPI